MVQCHSCGKNLGVFDGQFKWEKDGQTYCSDCSKRVLEEDLHEDLRAQMGDTLVCNFQQPIIHERTFKGYNCNLTRSVHSYADGVTGDTMVDIRGCNPDWCPMYQTWQLMKKDT